MWYFRSNITNGIDWSITFVLKGRESSDIVQFAIHTSEFKLSKRSFSGNNNFWTSWKQLTFT